MRNFPQHQLLATTRTTRLLLLFSIATAITAFGSSLVVVFLIVMVMWAAGMDLEAFTLNLALLTAVVTLLAAGGIGLASWIKLLQLRAGGRIVAEELGGVAINDTTTHRNERRALNVVQELAVAAGIPVPQLYVLEGQPAINAFAAGFAPEDAVIGLTKGCLVRLNREQLQGVVAHEFSHILNGDMRLNLRLLASLHGILGITLLAEGLMQTAHALMNDPGPSCRHDGGRHVVAVVFLFLGVFLWPIGLVGSFVGMIIMCATSRQREFLADASAVELTRNPLGLANALKMLAGHAAGSRVRSPKSLEIAHFFFAPGCRMMQTWFSSHPPLEERIRRLDPEWDGTPLFEEEDEIEDVAGAMRNTLALVSGGQSTRTEEPSLNDLIEPCGWEAPDDLGRDLSEDATRWHEQFAAELRSQLPQSLLELVHDRDGLAIVLLCHWLLHSPHPQDEYSKIDESYWALIESLLPLLQEASDAQRTVLLDDALAAYDRLPRDAQQQVRTHLQRCLAVPGQASDSLSLWSLRHHLRRRLNLVVTKPRKVVFGKLTDVREAVEVLLSALCHAGHGEGTMATYAFQRAAAQIDCPGATCWEADEIDCERLDVAIDMIGETAARPRREFMLALGCCITADQEISTAESDLLRGMAALLGMAPPRVLPGQPALPGT